MEISEQSFGLSAAKLTTKNAWAQYVRRRWPANCIKHVMAEWGLTDGEARGVVFAQASQASIDKILDHPKGGFALGLTILEIRMQTRLKAWVQSEQERLTHEANRNAALAADLAAMAAGLPADLGVGAGRRRRLATEPRSFGLA